MLRLLAQPSHLLQGGVEGGLLVGQGGVVGGCGGGRCLLELRDVRFCLAGPGSDELLVSLRGLQQALRAVRAKASYTHRHTWRDLISRR